MGISIGDIGGAAIGAAGSLLGSYMTGQSVADQMEFQKESLQNRYQWTMKDMRKAGLNPIYAYKGIGAGTLPGASAQFNNPLSGMETGLNTAKSMQLADQERRTAQAIEHKETMLGDQAGSQDKLNSQAWRVNQKLILPQLQKAKAEASSAQALADLTQVQSKLAKTDAKYWLNNPDMRELSNIIQRFNPLVPKTGISKTIK